MPQASTPNIGVIGYGYWGPNMVRNFIEAAGARVIMVADRSSERRAAAESRHPGIRTTNDPYAVINSPNVDAVVIVTPVRYHFDLALAAINAGKHVLVEKPMTETSEQGRRLIDAAAKRGVVLMVDHTFVFTGAVAKIRSLVENGDIGDIYYYDSTRINLGLFQHDVDVIWDLAVHDLSILNHLLRMAPESVSATGAAHIPGRVENMAFLTVFFDTGAIAHINVNWLSPVKIRRTLLGGSRKMVVYDDLEPNEKIKIYDKGITLTDDPNQISQMMIGYRVGDILIPQIDSAEALATEVRHFLECIADRKTTPISDGLAGLKVVNLCEASSQSMKLRGTPVKIAKV